jgi:predicted transcriptional regulator
MEHTICEYMMWNGLPTIRKEIAECMIKDYGLNQKETAEKLGITPAAICNYVSNKRGRGHIEDENILAEIKKAAKNIIENGHDQYISETCRICRIFRSKGMFSFILNKEKQ